jgi:hypothetical protein
VPGDVLAKFDRGPRARGQALGLQRRVDGLVLLVGRLRGDPEEVPAVAVHVHEPLSRWSPRLLGRGLLARNPLEERDVLAGGDAIQGDEAHRRFVRFLRDCRSDSGEGQSHEQENAEERLDAGSRVQSGEHGDLRSRLS